MTFSKTVATWSAAWVVAIGLLVVSQPGAQAGPAPSATAHQELKPAAKVGFLRIKGKGTNLRKGWMTLSRAGKSREQTVFPRTWDLKPGTYLIHTYDRYLDGSRYAVALDRTRFTVRKGRTTVVTARVRKTAVTPSTWRSVSIGEATSCGVKTDATLWCWRDAFGVAANPIFADIEDPAVLLDRGPWASVDVGTEHVCGLKVDRTAWCWGYNEYGQMGNATNTTADASGRRPTQVSGGGTWTSVGAGDRYSCGLRTDGSAWCWGSDRGTFALGQGDTGNVYGFRNVPVPVAGGHTFTTLEVGRDHACGSDTAGRAWCWGWGGFGGLGTTDVPDRGPVEVRGAGGWAALTAGENHTCGLLTDGSAWCWGLDDDGQLGDGPGSPMFYGALETIAEPGPWTALSSDLDTTCGLKADGSAWCWGSNDDGQLGIGTTSTGTDVPVPVSGGHRFSSISVGDGGACGIAAGGAAWCWGYNYDNRLGVGRKVRPLTPAPMRG